MDGAPGPLRRRVGPNPLRDTSPGNVMSDVASSRKPVPKPDPVPAVRWAIVIWRAAASVLVAVVRSPHPSDWLTRRSDVDAVEWCPLA